jgi:hypothetical protein
MGAFDERENHIRYPVSPESIELSFRPIHPLPRGGTDTMISLLRLAERSTHYRARWH